jgi:hypothetical protein
MGEADFDDGGCFDFPRCDIDHGVCLCSCEDCNPSVCTNCLGGL